MASCSPLENTVLVYPKIAIRIVSGHNMQPFARFPETARIGNTFSCTISNTPPNLVSSTSIGQEDVVTSCTITKVHHPTPALIGIIPNPCRDGQMPAPGEGRCGDPMTSGIIGRLTSGIQIDGISELTSHKGSIILHFPVTALATGICSHRTGGFIKFIVEFQLVALGVGTDGRNDDRRRFTPSCAGCIGCCKTGKINVRCGET